MALGARDGNTVRVSSDESRSDSRGLRHAAVPASGGASADKVQALRVCVVPSVLVLQFLTQRFSQDRQHLPHWGT